MNLFEYMHQHPWWTLIYLSIVAAMVISLAEVILKRK
jgi:hypothetical protein